MVCFLYAFVAGAAAFLAFSVAVVLAFSAAVEVIWLGAGTVAFCAWAITPKPNAAANMRIALFISILALS